MMDEFTGQTLAEFTEGKTQLELAALFGVTQGAISQMMRSRRDIRVRMLPDGRYQAYEIRPVGSRRKAA